VPGLRERDSKLDRDVAIKVLPDAFAQDKERLARFEREAKLLARLSHANVATLYGLEESEGRKFLVMELVEGETLAERLAKGPLTFEEAIPLFLQIAEGLEAAHEKGIVHRDLKPANIKITLEGDIKILDFGLAKAFASEQNVSAEMSQSPTLTKGTAVGAILGTPSYMSPEQARGKAVDRRTDVWAFGCCLYESLTGRKAFVGETVSDTLAAVLKNEPEWERMRDDTPTWLRSILERALRKETKRRLRDMGDVRIEIEDAFRKPASSIAPLVERRLAPVLLAALGAAFIGGVTVWAVFSPRSASPKPLKHLAINLPSRDRLNLSQGPVGVPLALSRDGSTLVYAGSSRNGTHQLFVRRMAELETIPVPGTEGAEQPFFSPDGHWIGFYDRRDRRLRKGALSGGPPVTLCDLTGTSFSGASWGENDVIFFGSRTGLREVPAAGGTPRPVTSLDADRVETSHRYPHVLPGQGGVLFVSVGSPDGISVVSLSTGEQRVLVEGSGNPRFASSGHLVFPRDGSLLAVPFDPERLEPTGAPVPVLAGVASLEGPALFDLADDGTIAYVPGPIQTRHAATLVRVDRDGVAAPLTETSQGYRYPRFSPMAGGSSFTSGQCEEKRPTSGVSSLRAGH
jgi:serine/threonine-protein kinase